MATKKKRPSSDELRGLLLEGNFGAKTDSLPITDPVSTTQMVLKLDDIIPYDKNPRRERNPEYENIKESIRSKKQLNNNFNVTRRPGDEKFMIESGGNTRLQILKELYQETGDEAFNTIHCLFVPWKSESAVLSAHLIENEMRGDMTLIDKAYAVQNLKKELEAEAGKKMSDVGFTKAVKALGYTISPKHLRRFNYAIHLDQMIPQVLRQGLGGHKIDRIKKVEKAYADYCHGKTEQFEMIFAEVMADTDTDEFWDFDKIVRPELDERLAEIIGIRENLLRLEVDAILFDRPGEVDFSATPPENSTQAQFKQINQIVSESDESEIQETSTSEKQNIQVISDENSVQYTNSGIDSIHDMAVMNDSEIPQGSEETPQKEAAQKPVSKVHHIHFFWEKGYNLAMKIGKNVGINTHCIMPAKCGMGFYLDRPDEQLIEIGFDEAEQIHFPIHTSKSLAWWMLVSTALQLPVNKKTDAMWSHTMLYQDMLFEQQNGGILPNELGLLVGGIPYIPFDLGGFMQSSDISDVLFTDIFRLMENCRTIKKHFTDEEIWEQLEEVKQ